MSGEKTLATRGGGILRKVGVVSLESDQKFRALAQARRKTR